MGKSAETVETVTFDQAFKDALAQHSEKAVEPAGDETKTELESAQEPEETPDALKEGVDAEQLITDEEYAKLEKEDPAKLRKALHTAFTQKTQKLSADRKAHAEALERYEKYRDFIELFEEDPDSAVSQLAEQLGLELKPPKTEKSAEEAAQQIVNQSIETLRKALGPDNEDLAAKLAPAIEEIVTARFSQEKPKIEKRIESIEARDLAAETQKELEAFRVKHPDWKTHEKAMITLAKKIQPAGDISTDEYLEILYDRATRNVKKADKTVDLVKKINKVPINAENPDIGVPKGKMVNVPDKPTIKQAFEMALRGELIE